MTSRSYCFTLNNPTIDEILVLEDVNCRYMIYGYETGAEGTQHLQGYIELSAPCRITGLKKLPGMARVHAEVRRGSRDEARNYCMKDGEFIEVGDWAAGGQGQRSDLKSLMQSIRNGDKTLQIMEDLPEVYSRNMRFAEKYQMLVDRESTKGFRAVETHVIIGEAGVGKSRSALEQAPEAFIVDPTETFPFDGYDGESEIIINDFYGHFKYCKLLNILDGYQFRVNVKGSHRYARWSKVFITSNHSPDTWYKRGLTPALARRLTSVTTMCNEEAGNTEPPLDPEMLAVVNDQ